MEKIKKRKLKSIKRLTALQFEAMISLSKFHHQRSRMPEAAYRILVNGEDINEVADSLKITRQSVTAAISKCVRIYNASLQLVTGTPAWEQLNAEHVRPGDVFKDDEKKGKSVKPPKLCSYSTEEICSTFRVPHVNVVGNNDGLKRKQ